MDLQPRGGVPAKHGEISNAYVKADKEEHLDILLHVPSGIQIKDEQLKALGVASASDIALGLKKESVRDFGDSC